MRGGRLLLGLLLIGLVALPFSLAADSSVYDKWHYSGDSFTADGEVFSVTHFQITDEKILLTVNNNAYTVKLGECALSSTKKYCFIEMFNDINLAKADSHIKFVGRDVYAGLHLKVYKRDSAITVTRVFSTTSPQKGDDVQVDVTIKNPTEFRTSRFYYEDYYNDSVLLVSGSSELEKDLHGVSFNKNIDAGSEKTFSYKIKFTEEKKLSSTAAYSYEIEGASYIANTTTYSVDLTPKNSLVFSFSSVLSKSSIDLLEETTLTINLYNKDQDELIIKSLELASPGGNLTFSTSPEVSDSLKASKQGSWSGTLEKGENASVVMKIKGNSPGKYTLPVSLTVQTSNNKVYSEKKNVTLTVNFKEPDLILSLKDASVTSGGKTRLSFSIKNPNSLATLANVESEVLSSFFDAKEGLMDQISPGDTKTLIVLDEIIAPFVETEKTYTINVSGSYTVRGLRKTFSKSSNLKVSPFNKSVVITQSLTKPPQLSPGKNITVAVSIQYASEEKISVHVYDIYSAGLEFHGGLKEAALEFNGPGTKQAYVYNVVIPQNYLSSELNITTNVVIQKRTESLLKTVILPVNITRPITASENKSMEVDSEENIEVDDEEKDKVGVVDSIVGFFKNLFGMGK